MPAVIQAKGPSSASLRRTAVCLLLAIVSLYNPFLTISGACEVLHVHHPLSFRATIASCELGRCTLDDSKVLVGAPEAVATTGAEPAAPPIDTPFPARQNQDVFVPSQQVTVGGLWFRPPPSR
jgi:hypothetical protein